MLEQAIKFLQDPSVRDASSGEKLAFLESKGVLKADIERALGLNKSEVKNSQLPILNQPSGLTSSTPATSQSVTASSSPTPPPLPAPEASAVPPIITYPEFLIHSQKPPPLITISRLRNTAYLGGGIAALIYGASTYLLTPLSDALTAARHDFAIHTATHLDELNRRLGERVSADPGPRSATTSPILHKHSDGASDAASDDSDPTELFHRDFGVQTSPKLRAADDGDEAATATAAALMTGGADHDDGDAPEDATSAQSARLMRLTALCAEHNDESSAEGDTAQETSTVLKVLREYLDEMVYAQDYHSEPLGVYGDSAANASAGGRSGKGGKTEDEIGRMKAEIRGFKGVLLSARNFPAGSGGTGGARRLMFPAVQSEAVVV